MAREVAVHAAMGRTHIRLSLQFTSAPIIPTEAYQLGDMLTDLLDFAAKTLRISGMAHLMLDLAQNCALPDIEGAPTWPVLHCLLSAYQPSNRMQIYSTSTCNYRID